MSDEIFQHFTHTIILQYKEPRYIAIVVNKHELISFRYRNTVETFHI